MYGFWGYNYELERMLECGSIGNYEYLGFIGLFWYGVSYRFLDNFCFFLGCRRLGFFRRIGVSRCWIVY